MDQNQPEQKCSCPHHKMVPIFLVLLGLAFLARTLGMLSTETVNIIWPILIVLIGLQKIFQNKCKCCK